MSNNPLYLSEKSLEAWENVHLAFPWDGGMKLSSLNSKKQTFLVWAIQAISHSAQWDFLQEEHIFPLIEELVQKGITLKKTKKNEWSPLQHAANSTHGSSVIVQLLLEHGAELEEKIWDDDGCESAINSLVLAIGNGNADIVDVLLGAGADIESLRTNFSSEDPNIPLWLNFLERFQVLKVLPTFFKHGYFLCDELMDGKNIIEFLQEKKFISEGISLFLSFQNQLIDEVIDQYFICQKSKMNQILSSALTQKEKARL